MYICVLSESPNGVLITLRPYMPIEPRYPQWGGLLDLCAPVKVVNEKSVESTNSESITDRKTTGKNMNDKNYLARSRSLNGMVKQKTFVPLARTATSWCGVDNPLNGVSTPKQDFDVCSLAALWRENCRGLGRCAGGVAGGRQDQELQGYEGYRGTSPIRKRPTPIGPP